MRRSCWPGAAMCLLVLAGPLLAQSITTKTPPSVSSSATSEAYKAEVGGKTLKQWMTELKSRDPSKRARAIVNIVHFGEPAAEAVPVIIDRTQDAEASPRVKAVLALKLMAVREKDIPRVVDALARSLSEDPQAIVRYEAARGLLRFAKDAKSAIPALVKRTQDPVCWEIRHTCIMVLRTAGMDEKSGPDRRVTQALLDNLRDPTEEVRLEATLTLGAMGAPPDQRLLNTVVDHLQQQVRYKDRDKVISLWSNVALMAIDDKVTDKSLQAIVKLCENPERDIRVEAVKALGAIGTKARTGIPVVLGALEDKEKEVVIAACYAAPRMGDRSGRVIDPLIKVSQRKEPDVVWAACTALKELGNVHPDVLHALEAVGQRKELPEELQDYVRLLIEDLKHPDSKKSKK